MPSTNSEISVLTCNQKGKRAAKKFTMLENGSIHKIDFNAGKFFTHEAISVSNLQELGGVLESISDESRKFVIRGKIKENMGEVVQRKCYEPGAAFDPVSRPFVMLDVDKLPCPEFFDPVHNPDEIITWVLESLPEPFKGASCYYQFSSSQNVPYKAGLEKGKISLHAWFWCNKDVSDDEWKRYFKSVSSHVDCALFSPVQPHYTAKPIFENMPDPLPNRSGFFKGKYDIVTVPEFPEANIAKTATRSEKEPAVDEESRKKALELLLPHYKEGGRNRLSGAIAATLYRGGWQAENAADFVCQIAETAFDDEINERYNNAIRICNAVDQNLPAQGIPILKQEFGIRDIDQILSLLGVGETDIQDAISKLSKNSDIPAIKKVMSMFLHLSKSQQKIYIEHIKAETGKAKSTLDAIMKELKIKHNISLAKDGSDIAMERFLAEKYSDGDYLLRASDSRYFRYNLKYWEYMPDDLVRSELLSYARASIYDSENTTVARNINDAMTILCGRVYRESDPFRQINRNVPSIINCLNGELCFDEAGQVTFNPHRPESYLRNCLNVSYDPNATSPMFDAAVLEIFSNSSDPQDMFRHFMELASYISQPWRKLAVIILLHGGGSNGKTSLLGIIRRILGENTVMSGRLGDIEKNDFKIGDLDGKLMVLDDDVDGGTCIPDGFLKKISEEKPLTGQHKFKPPFEFICRAVPVMLANDYPATRDLSYGLRRRLMVIPFNRTFEPHEIKSDLFEKIWEQEAQGILNHIIRSFGVLKARGRFQESADCIEAKKEWIKRSNTLTTFIDEECELGDDYSIHIRELYQAFQHYCRDAGVRNVLSRRNFTQRLKDLKYRISIRGGEDAVCGFKLSYVGAVKNSEHTLPDLR